MSTRILVVDDDPDILLGLRTALELDGHVVVTAVDGAEALSTVAGAEPDAVVLDVTMPRLDGLAVLRTLRSLGDRTPILLLTARDTPGERVLGLDAGADDYLGKPFEVDELLARVRALVRRVAPAMAGALVSGGLRLDEANRVLETPEGPVRLTRIEAALLRAFFLEPLRVRSREELSEVIWEDGTAPRSNALDVYVGQLRRKLIGVGVPGLIVTVRGLGYRLADR